ncbi:uncharacterized protein Dmoj_GI25875 [Drosophila mojavensis]|uniref:Uncharacterized protein n=1 Tax=Drosophila mojavensis TaxID=7230 RepID=A0A0Q9XHA1_DROMO|nr:uncharacterized protein Dmoj_GI25875 [Drosophila mojavensis]
MHFNQGQNNNNILTENRNRNASGTPPYSMDFDGNGYQFTRQGGFISNGYFGYHRGHC